MNQEFVAYSRHSLSADAISSAAPGLPALRVTLEEARLSPELRGQSVAPFALRNEFRTAPSLATLQKCAGMALVGAAWLLFLLGLAHLVLAALHNQGGELGMGVESTLAGAKSCLAALLLGAAGVPQWVMAARKLRAAGF